MKTPVKPKKRAIALSSSSDSDSDVDIPVDEALELLEGAMDRAMKRPTKKTDE